MISAKWPAAALGVLLWVPVALDQNQPPEPAPTAGEMVGVVRGQAATRIALGVPPPQAGAGASLVDAAEIGQILRDDLEFSGYFGLLDPEAEGRLAPGQFGDPSAWKNLGAAFLARSTLSTAAGRALFHLQLFETGGGTALFDLKWGGQLPADLRRLAHVAADTIVKELTGLPGIAQTRIAFASGEKDAKEIFLMDYDGARLRRLTSTGTINLAPAWSPDARQLTFLSFRARKPSIYLLSDAGKITTLSPRGGELNQSPDIAGDGRRVAFSSDRDGNSEIYLYDLQTGAETRLTHHLAIDTAPAWSPSGREIAFTSDRSGTPQIYIMNADGTNVRRLTMEGNYNESAAWSPDGSRLAFVSRLGGRFELVVHELATRKETIISDGFKGNKENPRWAPDSRHLVFSANPDGVYSIYTLRDDGTDLRRLTRGVPAFTPDWSPLRQ